MVFLVVVNEVLSCPSGELGFLVKVRQYCGLYSHPVKRLRDLPLPYEVRLHDLGSSLTASNHDITNGLQWN